MQVKESIAPNELMTSFDETTRRRRVVFDIDLDEF